jgi:hypothetical protein
LCAEDCREEMCGLGRGYSQLTKPCKRKPEGKNIPSKSPLNYKLMTVLPVSQTWQKPESKRVILEISIGHPPRIQSKMESRFGWETKGIVRSMLLGPVGL